ncbi:hypothetical protein CCP1ISM_2230003 [Azospirillaceae bacterium]
MVDLGAERKKRAGKAGKTPGDKPAKADSEDALIARLGEAVISYWQTERGPLIVVAGDPWTYRDGVWHLFDTALHHNPARGHPGSDRLGRRLSGHQPAQRRSSLRHRAAGPQPGTGAVGRLRLHRRPQRRRQSGNRRHGAAQPRALRHLPH